MHKDPKTGAIYEVDDQGLFIEKKNNTKEVWEVINHIEKYLFPPMQNGIYPKTKPAKRSGHRIEVNQLTNWSDGTGYINILIYPSDWDILERVVKIIDQAVTEKLFLKLIIDRDNSDVPGHLRIKYEHTRL